MMKRITLIVSMFVASVAANAATLDAALAQTSGDPSVSAGVFYGYRTATEGPGDDALEKARALAKAEHVPLVVVWSEEDCSHCNAFIDEMNNKADEVAAFLSTNRAVFAFFKADTANNNAPTESYTPKVVYDAYRFATVTCGAKASFPLFAFYHEKTDGTPVTGGTPSGYDSRDWAGFKSLYLQYLSDNGIDRYRGGTFAASGTEFDRYEAESATTNVLVDLVRDAENAPFEAENFIVATWPDGTASTNKVSWAVGATDASVAVALPAERFAAGEEISLALFDAYGNRKGTNPIAMVADVISNRNPLWIGERTAESLAFGEWTMDLDAATNKVAAFDGAAYTLVSLQGSRWCPDCGNADRNFMDIEDGGGNNRFRAWAAANNVALVAVDIPNYNGPTAANYATPSLLSRDAYPVAIARAKEWPANGADASLTNRLPWSGRAYISRKMIPAADAEEIRIRNHFLVSTDTALGGFHRPEDSNKNRTGVPLFVLLRKDGTVASRMTRFAAVAPMADERNKWDNYITRFDEMLAGATDAAEIDNNHWSTTTGSVSANAPVSGAISHTDTDDWYEINGAEAGALVRLRLSGDSTNAVTLAVAAVADGTATTKASAKAAITEGVSVDVKRHDGERLFARVYCANTDAGFQVDSTNSTVAAYSIKMEADIPPAELDPGEIAFETPSLRVLELAGTGTVQVVRRDGGYGAASVRVTLKSQDPTAEGRFAWTDQTLSWGDGETGAKEVGFALVPNETYEGVGTFTLGLEKTEGDAFVAADVACAVQITDTDTPCFDQAVYDVSAYSTFATASSFRLLNVRDGDTQVTVSRTSGSAALPAGLKLAYDKTTGNVVLSGVPKKPGMYEIVLTVSVRRNGSKVTSEFETTLRIAVADPVETNPRVAEKRPNRILPLTVSVNGTNLVAGTLSFAATSKGALSAKYAGTEGKTISFAGNWQDLSEDGSAVATLTAKGATLDATMDVDGRLSVALSLPEGLSAFDGEFTAEAPWPQTDVFGAFKGYYTVALPRDDADADGLVPSGAAFLTLNMATASNVKSGIVRYAGTLPDGTSVSGSAPLERTADGSSARLAVFSRSAKNVFGAILDVGADGASKWTSDNPVEVDGRSFIAREIVTAPADASAYVLHREKAWEYLTFHAAYGAYYNRGVSPQELDAFYEATAGYDPGAPFVLAFDTSSATESERYGALGEIEPGGVNVGAKTLTLAKRSGLSFSFNASTGVFKGAAKVAFGGGRNVTTSYSGVVVPGWVLPCDCGIVAPELPFGYGALRFRDVVDGKAATRSIPVVLDK